MPIKLILQVLYEIGCVFDVLYREQDSDLFYVRLFDFNVYG